MTIKLKLIGKKRESYLVVIGLFQKSLPVHGDNNYFYIVHCLRPVQPEVLVIHEGEGIQLVNRMNIKEINLAPFSKQLAEKLMSVSNELDKYKTT